MLRCLRRALVGLALVLAPPALASGPLAEGEADEADIPPKPERFPGSYIHQLLYGPEDPGKPQLLMYPVLAYAPETRLEVGLSALVLFHSKGDVTNRLSEVPLYAFYTMNNQYGLVFEHAIFSDGAHRSYLGEGILADFLLKYYGIGIDARREDAVVVYAQQLVVRERVLFRIGGSSDVFFGPEVGFASFGGVRFEAEDGRPVELPVGGDGTTNLTMGFGIAYDTRHNPLNVREGVFAEIAWLGSTSAVISEHSFANLYADLRGY